ncbi:MAG: hypothetical protein ACTSRG_22250, partial [Candidatus Helarchaeota archaeon]
IRFKYYMYENSVCLNYKNGIISAENSFNTPRYPHDYEIEAKIFEIRFKEMKDFGEIKIYPEIYFYKVISESGIVEIIKRY